MFTVSLLLSRLGRFVCYFNSFNAKGKTLRASVRLARLAKEPEVPFVVRMRKRLAVALDRAFLHTPVERLLFRMLPYPVRGFATSWQFAAAYMAFVFVHEFAHSYAAAGWGNKTNWMTFLVVPNVTNLDVEHLARSRWVAVNQAGPTASVACSVVAAALALVMRDPTYGAVALTFGWITLANLIPSYFPATDGTQIIEELGYGPASYRSAFAMIFVALTAAPLAVVTLGLLPALVVGALVAMSLWQMGMTPFESFDGSQPITWENAALAKYAGTVFLAAVVILVGDHVLGYASYNDLVFRPSFLSLFR